MAKPSGVQTLMGKAGMDEVVRTAEGQIRAAVFEVNGTFDEQPRPPHPLTVPYTTWLENKTERWMYEEDNMDDKDDINELKLNSAAVRKLLLCEDTIYRQQKLARIKHLAEAR